MESESPAVMRKHAAILDVMKPGRLRQLSCQPSDALMFVESIFRAVDGLGTHTADTLQVDLQARDVDLHIQLLRPVMLYLLL